jgi:hypothetical protein
LPGSVTAVANATPPKPCDTYDKPQIQPMKTSLFKYYALLTFCGCLLPMAASAQTTAWTATASVKDVLSPGIVCTNSLGQVMVRGIMHTERMQASDPRLTSQVLAISDGAYNLDGTVNLQGTSHLVVGTWDASGTNFTPVGGVWETTWRGILRTDYNGSYSITGYGVGGTIDGQRLEATLTVTNATGPWEAAYLFAGTIKPPPVTTTNHLELNSYSSTYSGNGSPILNYDPGSRALTLGASWLPSPHLVDTCAGIYYTPWPVPNSRSIEVRVDLVNTSPGATLAMVALNHSATECYDFEKGNGFVILEKWHSPTHTCLYAEKVGISSTNVVLVLALTPAGHNVLITGKLLDRESGTTLYQTPGVLDTPDSDSSLTAPQLAQITGLRQWPDYGPDPAGAPWFDAYAAPALVVAQDTDVATQASATFANFEVRTFEVPQVSITRAVQLSLPIPAGLNYAVEAAPTVQGPWLTVQPQETPGIQTLTVPVSASAQFFRAVPVP